MTTPIGHCEACSTPIYETTPHSNAGDGILFCETHAYTLQQIIDQQQEIWQRGRADFVSDDWFDTFDELAAALAKNKNTLAVKGDHQILNG